MKLSFERSSSPGKRFDAFLETVSPKCWSFVASQEQNVGALVHFTIDIEDERVLGCSGEILFVAPIENGQFHINAQIHSPDNQLQQKLESTLFNQQEAATRWYHHLRGFTSAHPFPFQQLRLGIGTPSKTLQNHLTDAIPRDLVGELHYFDDAEHLPMVDPKVDFYLLDDSLWDLQSETQKPCLALTHRTDRITLARLLEREFDDVICKPFSDISLHTVLKNFVDGHRHADKYSAFVHQAVSLLRGNQLEEAKNMLCESLFMQHDNLSQAHYLLGVCAQKTSHREEAIKQFDLALHYSGDHLLSLLKKMSLEKGDQTTLERILNLYPGHAGATAALLAKAKEEADLELGWRILDQAFESLPLVPELEQIVEAQGLAFLKAAAQKKQKKNFKPFLPHLHKFRKGRQKFSAELVPLLMDTGLDKEALLTSIQIRDEFGEHPDFEFELCAHLLRKNKYEDCLKKCLNAQKKYPHVADFIKLKIICYERLELDDQRQWAEEELHAHQRESA